MRPAISILLLITLLFCGCHSSAKTKSRKKQEEPKPEYAGDNIAPTEVRALKDAKQLQKDINKKQEEEKELLKERD